MSDIFRFPNGYDVKVFRKEDIIASIEANITDKDVALEVIRRCEIDASNFIREGRWASIPFIGSIRIPRTQQELMSKETQDILNEAKSTLDADKYILFRKSVANDIGKRVKIERYYKYVVSKFVGKNYSFFRTLSSKKGDCFARIIAYTLSDITNLEFNNYE